MTILVIFMFLIIIPVGIGWSITKFLNRNEVKYVDTINLSISTSTTIF